MTAPPADVDTASNEMVGAQSARAHALVNRLRTAADSSVFP